MSRWTLIIIPMLVVYILGPRNPDTILIVYLVTFAITLGIYLWYHEFSAEAIAAAQEILDRRETYAYIAGIARDKKAEASANKFGD